MPRTQRTAARASVLFRLLPVFLVVCFAALVALPVQAHHSPDHCVGKDRRTGRCTPEPTAPAATATPTIAPITPPSVVAPAEMTATPIPTLPPTSTLPATATHTSTPTPTATMAASATASATATTASPQPTSTPTTRTTLRKDFGVNVAGAEFGEHALPGALWVNYLYPVEATRSAYFAGKGQTLLRLPFRWERVQHSAYGPLVEQDIAGMRAFLDMAHASGQQVILDLHNYGRYYGAALTRADAAKLADVWAKLAQTFRGHPALYGYELMNEPHDLPEGSDAWASLAQVATDAIRQHDTTAWVLVPGYSWQSARFWPENNPTLNVQDPTGRLLYAAHLYFDANYTGTYAHSYDADGTYPHIGVDRLQPFLHWLESRNARGMLTEYGVPDNDARWNTVLDTFMAVLQSHPRIQGGTYWAAGPWWGSYPLSVEPRNGQDRPQMAVLSTYPSTIGGH
ncbi:MAG TPA: glycoside hydrolase family 5 protein [Chloroflexota bacterium]|nr:glycoside hydrolase family 5 protein [Chloroflexota bacterium]